MKISIKWKSFGVFSIVHIKKQTWEATGWSSNIAGANFSRLKKIYGEDVVNKIKSCRFYYKESINKRARQQGEKGDKFKTYALDLLTASTQGSYNAHKNKIEDFIKENESSFINWWLKWWDERRKYIFQEFKDYKDPWCNQVQVIHKGWI